MRFPAHQILSPIKLAIFCSVFAFVCRLPGEDNRDWVQRQNVPDWIVQLFSAKKLCAQYEFAFTLNPFYLRGDFNGDGKPDAAILVRNKESAKVGIAICHARKNEVFFVGAGTTIGNAGDDFSWIDAWQVYAKARAGRRPKLIGEGLLVGKSESGGGLIYWDGKNYKWQQHGD
jgi:hypothetical protein